MSTLIQALQVYFRNFLTYLAVVVLCYGPWLITIKYFASTGALTPDGAEAIAGLIGVFFMPLCNGAIVWLNQGYIEGRPVTIVEALTVAAKCWKDLITAYISVGFIMLGYLAVAVLPGGILMLILGLKSPLILVPFGAVAMIYVMTRYVFLDFYIVLRRMPGWSARRACPELTKGRILPLAVAYLILAAPLFFSEFAFSTFGGYLEQVTGMSRHMFEAGLSLMSTLLYVIAQLYFYLIYRDITSDQSDGKA